MDLYLYRCPQHGIVKDPVAVSIHDGDECWGYVTVLEPPGRKPELEGLGPPNCYCGMGDSLVCPVPGCTETVRRVYEEKEGEN